ncbi:MAG: hypothetical protein AAGA80_22115, partial [Cyanobacteria bacterium P01_F01_bin.143]
MKTPKLSLKKKQNYKPRKQRKSSILFNPRFAIAIAIVSLLLLCTIGPARSVFNQELLVNYFNNNSCSNCVTLTFLGLYTVLTVIGIPGTILTLVGGLIFGLW